MTKGMPNEGVGKGFDVWACSEVTRGCWVKVACDVGEKSASEMCAVLASGMRVIMKIFPSLIVQPTGELAPGSEIETSQISKVLSEVCFSNVENDFLIDNIAELNFIIAA